jgi:hypothetical protein
LQYLAKNFAFRHSRFGASVFRDRSTSVHNEPAVGDNRTRKPTIATVGFLIPALRRGLGDDEVTKASLEKREDLEHPAMGAL